MSITNFLTFQPDPKKPVATQWVEWASEQGLHVEGTSTFARPVMLTSQGVPKITSWVLSKAPTPAQHRDFATDPSPYRVVLTALEEGASLSPDLFLTTASELGLGWWDRDHGWALFPGTVAPPSTLQQSIAGQAGVFFNEQGVPMKTCTKCDVTKPTTEFYRRRSRNGPGGYAFRSHCKDCVKGYRTFVP